MSEIKVTNQYRVWDLPTRFFHWFLVIAIAVQFASAEFELLSMQWHVRGGYFILGLLVFRVIWGVIGSDTARFSYFLKGPRAVLHYLRGAPSQVGHNPLGALSVVAMLVAIGLQTVSGLFANDEIDVFGPLISLVSSQTAHVFNDFHEIGQNVILLLIALHLAAVLFYRFVRKRDLIKPMLTGKDQFELDPQLQFATKIRAFFALLVAFTVVSAVYWYGMTHPIDPMMLFD